MNRRTLTGLLGATAASLLIFARRARAQTTTAGKVDRVQGTATAQRAAGDVPLTLGDAVYEGDVLKTGPAARLSVLLNDGQSLVLGENGEIEIDAFVFNTPDRADASFLRWTSGAFLTVTGAIGKANPNAVRVETPVATIGIRGTQFWGGRLAQDFEVLLIEGQVIVFNAAGAVVLNPGQSTAVASAQAPPVAASIMPDARRTQAFATVTFQ